MASKVVPRCEAKGTDILLVRQIVGAGVATCQYMYIIRSDLGCFMRFNLSYPDKKEFFILHPLCRGGDHYLFLRNYGFYIIKGNSYYQVSDLSTAADAKEGTLHKNCQGGDFYMAHNEAHWLMGFASGGIPCFTIIFSRQGKCRVVSDLCTDADAREFDLHESFQGGLYYWAEDQQTPFFGNPEFHCLKQVDPTWGLRVHTTGDLKSAAQGDPQPFDPDATNFLPGGLSVTVGPTHGQWHCIDSYKNDDDVPFTYNRKVTRKVGYKKEVVDSIEHNWNVTANVTKTIGMLSESLFKAQISLSGSYGGKKLDSTREEWVEEHSVEENVNVVIAPEKSVYFWQYKIGMGQKDVLSCQHKGITNSSNPPEEVPLPPAASPTLV